MVDVWLPYGKTEVCARIPTRSFLGSIEPKEKVGVAESRAEIKRALDQPIGTKRLREIAKAGDRVAIVVDDSTRATPSYLMISPLLDELNEAGVKDEDITQPLFCKPRRVKATSGRRGIDENQNHKSQLRGKKLGFLGQNFLRHQSPC